MENCLICGAQVYLDGAFRQADVLCADGKIAAIGQGLRQTGGLRLDARGYRLVPGFLDIHTHGAAGVDVNAADEAGLKKIAAFFASQGTTSWLASVLTDTQEQTLRCIGAIRNVMAQSGYGAQLMGIHLEGPFLSQEYKGAIPEHLLQKGDAALFARYQEAAQGAVKYLTVAPEVEGVLQLIADVSGQVAVAIGHSGASYETSMQAIANGARCITHTFNAMKLFHQHFPAIMGAALESDAYCEAICDGRHLHPGAVRMLLKCKGPGRVIAVTDSIMAAGLPDGRYMLGVNDVVVEQGDAKLASTGVRAGSTLTTGQALRNLVAFTGRPVEEVLPLLTENPAAALRMQRQKGRIRQGMDADMVLLDAQLQVCATLVGGNLVYDARQA